MTDAPRKRGRPRGTTKPDAARAWVQVRVTEEQRERYRAATELDGRTASDVARAALDRWAAKVLGR